MPNYQTRKNRVRQLHSTQSETKAPTQREIDNISDAEAEKVYLELMTDDAESVVSGMGDDEAISYYLQTCT